jgi:Asp-tRNA(Asn)/Glu-tRNA(Gln) amidotransferase A subunit family amidase
VVPLPEGGVNTQAILPFGPELSTPKEADLIGRYASIADYHELYKSGDVTPLQVVEAILPLIRRGQTPRSKYDNAWVDTYGNEEQAVAAARASSERYAAGKPLGIMDGIPFGVKDDIKVKGYVSHNGMKLCSHEPFFQPDEKTDWPVQSLLDAGAIIVGRAAMHELGSGKCSLLSQTLFSVAGFYTSPIWKCYAANTPRS